MLGKKLSPRFKKLEDDFKNNGGEWKEVVAKKLFSIKGNPQLNKDSFVFTEDEKYPYFTRTVLNNGVAKYVGNYGYRKIFNFNDTISLADRGVFKASTQNENFYIGTRVKALQFKDGNKSLEQRLFIVSQINKLQVLFEEYSINATDSLPNLKIELPFKNKKLDFQFMEDFIRVIEKLVIKDVVIWADKKIQATKQVIGKN